MGYSARCVIGSVQGLCKVRYRLSARTFSSEVKQLTNNNNNNRYSHLSRSFPEIY